MLDTLAETGDDEEALLRLRNWQFHRNFRQIMSSVPEGAAESFAHLAEDLEDDVAAGEGYDPAFMHGMRQLGMFEEEEL